jgi:hypothetical protein
LFKSKTFMQCIMCAHVSESLVTVIKNQCSNIVLNSGIVSKNMNVGFHFNVCLH